jgi:acetyltransferase
VKGVRDMATVRLRAALRVRVRHVRRADQPAMLAFLRRLSNESRLMRFLSACIDLEGEAKLLTDVREPDRVGLVATLGADRRFVGHACYQRIGADRAEAAVVVADEFQGCGLGTLLLRQLASIAARHGIAVFEGEALPENHRLLAWVRTSFLTTVRSGPGWVRLEFPTRPMRPGEIPTAGMEGERRAAA